MGMNKSFLHGHLGKDPFIETKETFNVGYLSVASNKKYNDKDGEKKEITDWVNVKISGKYAEHLKQFSKGDEVLIEGKNRSESWIDKITGERKFAQYLIAESIIRLKKKDS